MPEVEKRAEYAHIVYTVKNFCVVEFDLLREILDRKSVV